MNTNVVLSLLLLSLFNCCGLFAQPLIPIDDSYTVTERYVRNKKTHPEITWPTLTFEQGQQFMSDLRYRQIGDRDLHLDAFLPASQKANRKAIILVHGGGWRSGNKSHFYPMANKLAQLGYVVILPEYRLSAEAPYPAGLSDINHAIMWVKNQALELNIDAKHLVLGGGSSGGQMAALVGATADQTLFKDDLVGRDTKVAAIIDLDGVLDFTSALGLEYENRKGDSSAAALWLGGAYEKMPERWKEASAASHISKNTPPMLVISSGQLRFTAGKEKVFAQLEQLGIQHQYFEFKDLFHTYWLFDPYLSQTVAKIDSFLAQISEQQSLY